MVTCKYLDDKQEKFRLIINKLMTAGIIQGDGSDPTSNRGIINLTHEQVRTLVFLYRTVCICINGKPKSFYVHRLVAELFLPNPNRLPEVNHKDENPSNNDVSNLEWCTSKYNKNYGHRAINFGISRGRPVVCIETGERYFSCGEAERKTGIHRGSIHACCTGYRNTKTAGGHHWSFAPDVREVKSDWNG